MATAKVLHPTALGLAGVVLTLKGSGRGVCGRGGGRWGAGPSSFILIFENASSLVYYGRTILSIGDSTDLWAAECARCVDHGGLAAKEGNSTTSRRHQLNGVVLTIG